MEKGKGLPVDSMDMTGKIREFPSHLQKGWEIGGQHEIPRDFNSFRNIIYTGMGGSAMAGDFVRSLLSDSLNIPFSVNRGYELPRFACPDTLFIASSYSGNTEETLSVMEQAVQKIDRILCITSGGSLAEIARSHGKPAFILPKGYPPRAALGFSLGALCRLFSNMGATPFSEKKMTEAVGRLESLTKAWGDPDHPDNLPREAAKKLVGKIPLIYADVHRLEPLAFRWKTQLNENSKTHAFFAAVPEMNHNEIIGWEKLEGTRPFFGDLRAVLLRSPEEHPRVALRMEIIKELIDKNGGSRLEIKSEGDDFLNRLLYLIYFGDWISLYLALFYGADPTEIDNINALKEKLSRKA